MLVLTVAPKNSDCFFVILNEVKNPIAGEKGVLESFFKNFLKIPAKSLTA